MRCALRHVPYLPEITVGCDAMRRHHVPFPNYPSVGGWSDDHAMMCHFTGRTNDGRTVEWNRGEWSGDHDLIRAADAMRGADPSLRAIAEAIASVVGASGQVSEALRAAMDEG